MKVRFAFSALSLCMLMPWQVSQAQTDFPNRAISYIVPVAPGGGSDFIGRAVTAKWGNQLGQTFVVENQGGGGGVIASQKTARAKPDGYTLMQGYVATLATSPATRDVPYDPVNSFTPIGMIGGTPNVLIVNSQLPIESVQDLIEYSKKNGDSLNYGSAGAGSLTHLLMELMKQKGDMSMEHISYKGIAPAFTDLIAGQTHAMFPGLAAAVPHLKTGSIRALAVTGEQRSPRFPDVPTFKELGIEGFDDVLQWYGVSGPAGMSLEVVAKLNSSLNEVLNQDDMEKQLEIEAVVPMPMSAQEFGDYAKRDYERWARLAKEQNIQLNN